MHVSNKVVRIFRLHGIIGWYYSNPSLPRNGRVEKLHGDQLEKKLTPSMTFLR